MIWFFLAGFISGAVGMVMYSGWWMRSHTKIVTKEEMVDAIRGHPDEHGDRDPEGRKIPEPDGNNADGRSDMGSAPEQRMEDKNQG